MDEKRVIGNRMALVGAIWYLLEWVFIFSLRTRPAADGLGAADVAQFYAANRMAVLIFVYGISAAILGRLVFVTGLRSALRRFPEVMPLLDLAFAFCILAVVLETGTYLVSVLALGLVASGQHSLVELSGALNSSAMNRMLSQVLWVPHGLFVAAAGLAMVRTGALGRWLGWLGVVAGSAFALTLYGGIWPNPIVSMVQMISGLTVMVWMVATGVRLARPSSVTAQLRGMSEPALPR